MVHCMTLKMLGFIIIISHTMEHCMTFKMLGFIISHTTSVGMTLTLVSFFLILIIILATKLSSYNSRTTRRRATEFTG